AIQFGTGGGGTLVLEGVDVQGHFGIGLREGSQLAMRNSRVTSESIGVDVNLMNAVATIEDSSITTRRGTGIAVYANGQLDVRGSSVVA
ncbi:hypothetical protein ACS229_29310, partial [Klebsiella pneumoniae]